MAASVTHVAYSDETHHNVGRFRGIGVITAPLNFATDASTELQAILTKSNVKELKWERVRTARERLSCLHVADWLFEKLGRLRADVLTWDTEDRRHRIPGRDDSANLHRMYYHLFRNVLHRRWGTNTVWKLYPDEQSCMDWGTIHETLYAVSMTTEVQRKIGDAPSFKLFLKTHFRIMQIVPSHSNAEPLIQLADFLVGMSVFSRAHFEDFQVWECDRTGQTSFLQQEAEPLSTGEKEKCLVLSEFYRRCQKDRLQISFKSTHGLFTRNPSTPLNFWHYTPQHERDKAPLRLRSPKK